MTVTPEELAAYADDQLDQAARARVAEAVAADPVLARQVERHQALKAKLAAHYAPVLEAPLPAALVAAVEDGGRVVSLSEARARRNRRFAWGGGVALALAASLTLAVVLQHPAGDAALPGYASGELAGALDTHLPGEAPQGAPVRVVISFADASGALCRGYDAGQGSGIACHDSTGWRLQRQVESSSATPQDASAQYRQAGSADATLMAMAQDMAHGPALDPAAERAARAAGWRRH